MNKYESKPCFFPGKVTFPIWVTTTFASLLVLWTNLKVGSPKEKTYDRLFVPYIVATCGEKLKKSNAS